MISLNNFIGTKSAVPLLFPVKRLPQALVYQTTRHLMSRIPVSALCIIAHLTDDSILVRGTGHDMTLRRHYRKIVRNDVKAVVTAI